MANILAIDDTAFWRNIVADGLRLKGHQVATAEDALSALARLSEGRFDLIVMEVHLPRISGWDFLEQVHRASQWKSLPVVFLTSEMQKDQLLRAQQLGVMDYLLKPQFSLIELIERVERRLEKPVVNAPVRAGGEPTTSSSTTPISPKPLLTRELCLERAAQVLGVRTLSGVVSKVIASASSPRTDMSDLATLVGRDPMLSARVVAAANRLANTADRRVVNNLMDAVRIIGSATIRDIASSLWVYDAMPMAEPDGYSPIRCWQHSIAVARLCELLASEEHRSIAYLLGLCHDLGEILFRSHFGTEYRQVLETVQLTGRPRAQVETQMLGLTHGELVQSILKQLGLPVEILQPIAAFHAATDNGAVPSASAARLLMIADAFSTGLMLNRSDQTGVRPLHRIECKAATGVEDPPPVDCDRFRADAVALTSECARLNAREYAELIPPVPVRRSVKVWLARDPSFSTFDPVAAALEPMVELKIQNRLPTRFELDGCDGVIVLTRAATVHGLTVEDVQACLSNIEANGIRVLYLCGKTPPPLEHASVTLAKYPVSFPALAEFVAALRTAPTGKATCDRPALVA